MYSGPGLKIPGVGSGRFLKHLKSFLSIHDSNKFKLGQRFFNFVKFLTYVEPFKIIKNRASDNEHCE